MDFTITALSKSYGNQSVLKNFSGSFQTGVCTVLMGPSGSGKTTLLRLIAGLEQPDSGYIQYPDHTPPVLSMVFQENRLCPKLDTITNLRLVLPSLSLEEIRKELQKVRLTDYEGKPVRELSGGMQRRVAIVRAVLAARHLPYSVKASNGQSPWSLVLLDEPLKGFDLELYQVVCDYLRTSLTGITTLLVTHDPDEADFFGKELILL